MNKAEREDFERQYEQKERDIEATHRLAAAMERVADAQEALTKNAVPAFVPNTMTAPA